MAVKHAEDEDEDYKVDEVSSLWNMPKNHYLNIHCIILIK